MVFRKKVTMSKRSSSKAPTKCRPTRVTKKPGRKTVPVNHTAGVSLSRFGPAGSVRHGASCQRDMSTARPGDFN